MFHLRNHLTSFGKIRSVVEDTGYVKRFGESFSGLYRLTQNPTADTGNSITGEAYWMPARILTYPKWFFKLFPDRKSRGDICSMNGISAYPGGLNVYIAGTLI